MATLRDRLRTRQAAHAMTSPSAILLAGAGAAAGILVGGAAAVPAAVGLGVAAWAARVALGLPKRTGARIALGDLAPPWRRFVEEALDARARFDRAVTRTPAGPLRERLEQIGGRVGAGVEECWRIACRGDVLVGALDQVDVADVRRQIEALRTRGGGSPEPGSSGHRTEQALQAQIDSAQRIASTARRASDDLMLLNARLDEAVARAIELSVQGSIADADSLGSDVEDVVGDMEALRQGLEEVEGAA